MPKELIDGKGHVAWAATHWAYGKMIATADGGHFEGKPSDATNGGVESPFRLLGQVNDEDADLCWTRFRCFDAESGTWISTDPLGLVGGTQTYGFDGAPTDVVDPFGLSTSGKPHTAAEQARAWQGQGNYPGVDDYTDITLKKGTVLYGGYPGPSAYYTTEEGFAQSGGSVKAFFRGLQVMRSRDKDRQHPVTGGYRPQVRKYVVKEDTPAATGTAKANRKHGPGGLTQVFVPDHENALEPVETIDLTP